MVNKTTIVVLLIVLTSCVTKYHIENDENGEPIVNKNNYSFNQKMTLDSSDLIDTTSIYIELLSEKTLKSNNNNFDILIFHNDGYFEKTSKKYFRKFKRNKNSVYYGGKFFADGDKIFIEEFYPAKEGKTNYYIKEISEGQINKDTVYITVFGSQHKYVRKDYSEIF
ncbi:hypothetical protein IMCC3317_36290 [Kordia antarctica]|uniref:Lipoprotein n=1 Tax=Kordia antarctica TaxID=1218801 RepID=A0A7L4ZP21_9FLAO|nr:hypothetical protein [Kordia antarctica]QHI38240.1 hypothetical protein IMCC3317_36290 [Kordia antarctica]